MRTGATLVLALVAIVQADMYLHNPRGSNNRLDEANRERNNANRLFDSQNNNRGGYNVGSVYYYEGSILPIEWTNQHSCGDQNNHCDQIIQYMCDNLLRDGSSRTTIPNNNALCSNYKCNTDLEFGMHENQDYYSNCRLRERNQGLFIADRNLQGQTAIYTRQNNNGQRRGYECPEERDYYPYWHPTPWRDIAILTTDVTRCPYYQAESENVKSRYACILPDGYLASRSNANIRRSFVIPITKEGCESIMYDDGSENGTYGEWREFKPYGSLSAPECVEAQWSRDNHLGNTVGGYPMYYNWTVPELPDDHCTIRIRYNITTLDYDAWNGVNGSYVARNEQVYNGQNNLQNRKISPISSVYEQFNFSFTTAKERGYVFRQNPVVKVFPDSTTPDANNFGLQLAINTNQFGRTFQDRGHSFAIREKSAALNTECRNIYNLNVRGKRGNIVQVYPGVEYDFVPNRLIAAVDDCVHIQWTGSNTNPGNNDGQGRAGSDRHNIVLLKEQNFPEGRFMPDKIGHWGNNYPANLDDSATFLGLSRKDRQALATLETFQYGGEMSELDDAGTYFDLGPRKVTSSGTYHYMCTRNNNFTNRGQKGRIIVQDDPLALKRIGWPGGVVETTDTRIEFKQGALTEPNEFRITSIANSDLAKADIERLVGTDVQINLPANEVSGYKRVDPVSVFEGAQEMGSISIQLDTADLSNVVILRSSAASAWEFTPLDTVVVDGKAVAFTDQGGYFVASTPIQYGLVVGIPVAIIVLLLVVVIIIGIIVYFRVRPEKWEVAKDNMHKTQVKVKRSFAKQV